MKKINCPDCKNNGCETVIDISGESDTYLDYLKIGYKNVKRLYVQCKKCGLIYRNPVLDKKEKKLLYEHFRDAELRGEGKHEYFRKITSLPKDQSENCEKCGFLGKYLQKTGNLLDLGCGAGVFLFTFKKYFPEWKVLGVEPTHEFADVARENGIDIFYGYLTPGKLKEKFDLIILIHVLEHMDNFRETLKMLKEYLKPAGLLYIEVPSAKDIGCLPLSHDRFMCQHDVVFSKEVLNNTLKDLGYFLVDSENFLSFRKRNNLRIIAKKL